MSGWAFRRSYDEEGCVALDVEDADPVVGLGFFDQLVGERGWSTQPAPGILKSLDALASPWFDPALVDPLVFDLYQGTSGMGFLGTHLDWTVHGHIRHYIVRTLLAFSRQLDIPVWPGFFPRRMASRSVEIHDACGRFRYRGWERTFERSDRVFYSAAVAVKTVAGNPYLVIAIPFLQSNLGIVFSVSNWYDGGLRLRSHVPDDTTPGVYFVLPGRSHYSMMPGFGLGDEIRVTPDTRPDGHRFLRGEHLGRFMGLRSFELYYEIGPKSL